MSSTPNTSRHSGILASLSAAEEATLDERGIPTKLGRQYRRTQVASDGYDPDGHTVNMAVSSENPVDRYYGQEILSHAKGAIRTGRLKQGVSLLFNHDYDRQIGRSTGSSIPEGGPLNVTARFGPSPFAVEKEADVAAGILVDVSIGYIVHEWEVTEDKNGNRTFTAVDWELLEVSLVTVPADPTVGVGRGVDGDTPVKVRSFTSEREAPPVVDPPATPEPEATPAPAEPISETPSSTTTPAAQRTITMADEIKDVAAERTSRATALRSIRKMNPGVYTEDQLFTDLDSSEDTGTIASRVADLVIKSHERHDVPTVVDDVLGSMSEREEQQYSIRNVYAAAVNAAKPGTFRDKGAEAGLEREVSQTLQKRAAESGLSGFGGGITIPSATSRALARLQFKQQQRALASGGNAGTTTNVTIVEADPIELLRYKLSLLAMGARMMTGLFGTIKMPRQSAAATSNWLAEGSAATESDITFDSVTLAPSRLSMWNAYYRDLLAQSQLSVESILAADRLAVLARSLETAGLFGSGTGPVPLGLLNQSGLAAVLAGTTRAANGTVTAGAGGVPMTFVDWNNMEAAIATANGDIGTLGIITTPKVRASQRSTPQIPGTASGFVWPNSKVGANGVQEGPLGYPAIATSNPGLTGFTANSVSNLHAAFMGVWDQAMIGDWGLSEVIADPYTGAAEALYNITEHAYYGIAFRHIPSFAVCTSALPQ